jgi:hypothetical protein
VGDGPHFAWRPPPTDAAIAKDLCDSLLMRMTGLLDAVLLSVRGRGGRCVYCGTRISVAPHGPPPATGGPRPPELASTKPWPSAENWRLRLNAPHGSRTGSRMRLTVHTRSAPSTGSARRDAGSTSGNGAGRHETRRAVTYAMSDDAPTATRPGSLVRHGSAKSIPEAGRQVHPCRPAQLQPRGPSPLNSTTWNKRRPVIC